MRVLILGMQWPPETFLQRLLRGLLEAGLEVGVITSRQPTREWLSKPGLQWIRSSTLLSKHWGLSFLRWKIGKKWDVLYFPWNSSAIQYLPLFEWGIPAVLSCRGAQIHVAPHNPERIAIREGLRKTFEKAAAVHCVSEAIRREAEVLGLDPAKAVVIRPAVDAQFFSPVEKKTSKNAHPLRLITTGSLIWRKGYEYLLMAVQKLAAEKISFQLEIIGDGSEKQRLLYSLDDMGLKDHVRLAGKLDPEEVRDRLRDSDVFVLSSLSEGISNAVLEAMACGLPVITTDCGGMREAVTDGVEGFVVPVRDPSAMAEKIAVLASNVELRATMGKAARACIEKKFRLEDQIREFIRLFEAAVSKV